MKWSYKDAIDLAMDALMAHEITLAQLERYTNDLWLDMIEENEQSDSTEPGD